MSDYTPGPWVGFIAENSFDILLAGRPGCIASCANDGDHDADANSRLIVAAPDMLAALRIIIDNEHRRLSGGAANEPTLREVIDGIDAGRAAIAKATGDA